MQASLSPKGVELLKELEGCKLTAYYDECHILTIGFGHTGEDVHEGMTITEEEAVALLEKDLFRFITCIQQHVKVSLSQNQLDALTILVYNIGEEAFLTSTLLHKLNDKAPNSEIKSWWLCWDKIKKNGKIMLSKVLFDRRRKEFELYCE